MTGAYLWLKVIHVLSATILFGTGLGTAFQMWMAHRSENPTSIALVARNVVLADFVFTTPAVVVQPVTGAVLVWLTGIDPFSPWLVAVYVLYAVAGTCWIPVVWLQIQVRDIARDACIEGKPLPPSYHRYMRMWFALGWPAFIAVIAIIWLMIDKPNTL